jgi:penicillin amidase
LFCVALPKAAAQDERLTTTQSSLARIPKESLRDSARARLAILDGNVSVPGLDSAVEVRRDKWGVPHIYARTQHDLFFAQGYVAAQDRLFQMEIWRRQGEGRLAEVLGPSYVNRDRFARLFKYRGDPAAEWRSYAPDAREIVTAFVSGVNAYITEVRRDAHKLPIEFSLLGFLPEPWTPDVPLARVTPLSGVSNGSSELLRARLTALVGAKEALKLIRTNPTRALDPAKGLDLAGLDPSLLGGMGQTFNDVTFDRIQGSNNWVVSGKKTATGKPILANDPHRAITNPAIRYVTHLVGPGWNVIGAGEPASPGVSIGHNERIAFGLTIVGMDQQDVYVERAADCGLRTTDRSAKSAAPAQLSGRSPQSVVRSVPRCYSSPTGPLPFSSLTDTIRVRGEAPRVVTLEFSRHGPVISVDSARGRAIVVRMVGQEPGTAAYLASLSLDRAKNWRDFSEAMARWKMPAENMVYADVDGNIGWIAAGLMPRRQWSGLLPVPGDGGYEWSGFVPVKDLPQAYNPRSGYIATANDNILRYMPREYSTPISFEFPQPSYRAERLHEVLRDSARFSVKDFERLQHDDLSLLARRIAPALVAAATRAGGGTRSEVRSLASWDFHMSRESAAPLIFSAWSTAAARQVSDAVLSPVVAPVLRTRTDWNLVDSVLRAGGKGDTIALTALDSAVATLSRRLGANAANASWGSVHVAELRHPVAAAFDLPPLSRSGDANTVFATGGPNYRQTAGASYRQIIDLADFDNSVAINVPGQSGQPESEYYSDLLSPWIFEQYFPLAYTRQRVERETKHVLTLLPAAR